MDPQTIRITIELPQGADLQASGGATGVTASGAGMLASSGAIDAGPPPVALIAALGDPETPTALPAMTDATRMGASTDPVDAGPFPARLAMEMEAKGPRHPFEHPEIGTLAGAMSPVLNRESRN